MTDGEIDSAIVEAAVQSAKESAKSQNLGQEDATQLIEQAQAAEMERQRRLKAQQVARQRQLKKLWSQKLNFG